MASSNKIKTLDRWFSKFIRLRDTDNNGIGTCCTCGKLIHYKGNDACHFHNRGRWGTRWEPRNVALGCVHCNRFVPEGNKGNYAAFQLNRYGPKIFDELLVRNQLKKKWYDFELDELIKYYKIEVKRLQKEKNFSA